MESGKYLNKLILMIKFMDGLSILPEGINLTQMEFRLIREIVLEEEAGSHIISSELARRLGITRSAVSQLVAKLEKRNVVKRVASPTDRKIFYVALSDSALSAFKKNWKAANDFVNRVVEEFGAENTDKLIALSEEFVKTFESVRKENNLKRK